VDAEGDLTPDLIANAELVARLAAEADALRKAADLAPPGAGRATLHRIAAAIQRPTQRHAPMETTATVTVVDDVTSPDLTHGELARQAYTAYAQVTGGKNFQGDPMPDFDELGTTITNAWIAAAYHCFALGYQACRAYELGDATPATPPLAEPDAAASE